MTQNYPSRFIFKAPFNDLSFGQVSYNLAKAMFKAGCDVSIFPIGDNLQLGAFDKIEPEFFEWFKKAIETRYSLINKETPCLQLWHLRGSDARPTSKSILMTFHELLDVTATECTICGLHDRVLFSSSFSASNFVNHGVWNCGVFPLAFDPEILKKNKEYLPKVKHFILVGKWEARKNTEQIVQTWLELFGNNNGYRLTCLVDNPFFQKEVMMQLTARALGNKDYSNITFLPRLATNSEMADLYNSADIDLSGLSSGEGWNLPAFNVTCLGKWSCVANHTAHKDWATAENSILVEPSGHREPWDGAFFKKGDSYNQGLLYNITKESMVEAMLKADKLAKEPNPKGEALKEKFTYENTLKVVLKEVFS